MRLKIGLMTLIALAAGVAGAQNIERTASPMFDTSRELQAMKMVPVCPAGSLVAVSGTRLVCGPGCRSNEYKVGNACVDRNPTTIGALEASWRWEMNQAHVAGIRACASQGKRRATHDEAMMVCMDNQFNWGALNLVTIAPRNSLRRADCGTDRELGDNSSRPVLCARDL